jgi:aminopeptidase N
MVKKMSRLSQFLLCWAFVSVSANSYRLPTTVLPTHYKVQILSHLGEPENFNFEGKVWIQVTSHEPTYNITLHTKELNITDDQVTVKDISSSTPKPVNVKNIELDVQNDFLVINLEEELEKDHNYEIYVPFKGVLADGLRGFYKSSYTDDKTKEKKWLGVTQFEAISARKAFPCFDEPAMKAVFEITIGHKGSLSSISNMPLVKTEPIKEKEGWVWDKYEPSVPMSTYLVAFIISDFGFKLSEPSQHNNVTFKIWARKDALNQVRPNHFLTPKLIIF